MISWLFLCLFLLLPLICHANDHRRQLPVVEPRIVGGSAAAAGAFPGFARWDQGCGGTLILPQVVLTAAHCHLGTPGAIRVNSISRTGNDGNDYDVDYVRIHPNYNGNREDPDWDFSILKLKASVPTSIATPVMLNDNPLIPTSQGDALVAVGFGRLEEGGKEDSESLQQVTLPYVTNEDCYDAYSSPRINDAALCAGQAGLDACQGDSGGPLFLASTASSQEQYQVGIVSWGLGCARPEYPGVYARISTGFPWIQATACYHVDDYDEDFCQGAHFPIDLSLEVDMLLDTTLYQNYSWGLYHINSSTTLYESVHSEDDTGVVTELVNTGAGYISVARKKDREQPVDLPVQDREDETIEAAEVPPNAIQLQFDNLQAGTYYFTIRNPFGTGLMGANNHVVVTQGGGRRRVVQVPHNTTFETFYGHYFTITNEFLVKDIRQQRQEDIAADSTVVATVEITVDVFYTTYANQTGWELRNLDTTEVLAVVSTGNTLAPALESYTFHAERGHTYQLQLRDTTGQGMTGGWASLWVGTVLQWKSDEDEPPFIDELTHTFVL